jgi:hypothetical protein
MRCARGSISEESSCALKTYYIMTIILPDSILPSKTVEFLVECFLRGEHNHSAYCCYIRNLYAKTAT